MYDIIYKNEKDRDDYLRICICDDNKPIHEVIKKYCIERLDNSQLEIISTFSAEELIKYYNKKINFDIIFLDIEMDSLSGIEAAKIIREQHSNSIIIFISNYPHYVFEAFSVEALHFLVKPVSASEFNNVFNRAISKYNSTHSSISLKWQGERFVIKIDEIKYIESYKRHITVYAENDTYEAIGKIPNLLKELAPHGFVRTHQGFIVNMNYIKRFDKSDVVLFDGTKIMLSVRKRTEALNLFDNYLKNKKW